MNRLPSAQDCARLIRPTLDETQAALEEHFKRPLIGWSYNPVRNVSKKVFSGEISVSAIDAMFPAPPAEKSRSPKAIGQKSNREVAHLVRGSAQGRSFYCHDLKPRKVSLSAEHSLTVSPGFYFVEDGSVRIYWLQPRRAFALSLQQMGMLNGLLKLSHFRDDFEDADLELLDLSAIDGVRTPHIFRRADLPTLSDDELQQGLENLLKAYLALKDVEFREARPSKPAHPEPPGLFD